MAAISLCLCATLWATCLAACLVCWGGSSIWQSWIICISFSCRVCPPSSWATAKAWCVPTLERTVSIVEDIHFRSCPCSSRVDAKAFLIWVRVCSFPPPFKDVPTHAIIRSAGNVDFISLTCIGPVARFPWLISRGSAGARATFSATSRIPSIWPIVTLGSKDPVHSVLDNHLMVNGLPTGSLSASRRNLVAFTASKIEKESGGTGHDVVAAVTVHDPACQVLAGTKDLTKNHRLCQSMHLLQILWYGKTNWWDPKNGWSAVVSWESCKVKGSMTFWHLHLLWRWKKQNVMVQLLAKCDWSKLIYRVIWHHPFCNLSFQVFVFAPMIQGKSAMIYKCNGSGTARPKDVKKNKTAMIHDGSLLLLQCPSCCSSPIQSHSIALFLMTFSETRPRHHWTHQRHAMKGWAKSFVHWRLPRVRVRRLPWCGVLLLHLLCHQAGPQHENVV